MSDLVDIINQFEKKKILVVGDLILDSYLTGKVRGMSPEGIHPVVLVRRVKDKKYYLGGACNVACNLVDLGAETYLCGVVGKDNNGERLIELLCNKGINIELVVNDDKNLTIEKERIIGIGPSGPEKIVRVDEEDDNPISRDIQDKVLEKFLKYTHKFDAVAIADYQKGFVVKRIAGSLPTLSKNGLTIVDTKQQNINLFKEGFRFFTPNQYEAEDITGLSYNGLDDIIRIEEIGKKFSRILYYDNIIMTCGADGMIVYDREGSYKHIKAIKPKEPYDISGAGDTVVSVLALALSSGADIYSASLIASHAASIVVGKTGVASVSKNELFNSLINCYR
jgi:rfaE bifunctional protein kinase chain/domain